MRRGGPWRGSFCPSEYSLKLGTAKRYRIAASSRKWLLVQSPEPGAVSPLLVWRAHFAVCHFLGCVGLPHQVALTTVQQSVRTLRVSPSSRVNQPELADQPQPASSSHGLLLPTAHKARRSTCCGLCLGPLRSALRVWLPSRRLTPSAPLPAFFHAGGAHGIRPAELSPPERYPPRFRVE